jgi:carbonic anhydrase
VRYTIRVILERSEIVRKQYEAGKVQFAGGVYHLREGKVEWLKLPEGMEGNAHAEKSAKEASHSGH